MVVQDPAEVQEKRYANRPPRIQPELPQRRIPIPNPPEEKQSGMSIRTAIFPLITIIGYVVVSFLGQGRNLLFILPMGVSVIATSIFAFWTYFQDKRKQKAAEREYDQMLAEMRREMVAAHDMQRSFYEYNYPDPATTQKINGQDRNSRSGSRLWERRTFDGDFAMVRIGVGSRPSTVIYEAERGANEETRQMKDAIKLDEDSRIVFDLPITLPLYQQVYEKDQSADGPPPVRHAIGVSGEREGVYAFVNAMFANLTVFHSPNDLNLHVVGVGRAARHWDWIYGPEDRTANQPASKRRRVRNPRIPHFAMPKLEGEAQVFPVCFEDPSGKYEDREIDPVARFFKVLRAELDRRDLRLQDDSDARNSVSLPFMLLVVDMMEDYDPRHPEAWLENSTLKEVEAEAAVAMLMQKGIALGAAVVFLVPERQKIPSGCTAVIELGRTSQQDVDFRYAEIGVNTPRYIGSADLIPQFNQMESLAVMLNKWMVRRSYGEGIPDSITLLEMNDVKDIPGLQIETKWRTTREATETIKSEDGEVLQQSADWLKVALGVMSNNEPRRLYFKADGDGVHGMIAGSTGSGKSELLMSLILGLAIEYDPSIVNFVLIDYKGGAAFVPFETLPHCVDIVTNLQGAAVDRMFKAINAELNRRQEINTVTDSKHIVDYRERGLHLMSDEEFLETFGVKKQPYPHLFIIIDEFAEMMEGNAEYKEQLNSITRLGRALGVSLILAAQRPTGVTDQMRANIKFRISLRVETREESSEMLRRPDAAYLPPGIPGRGYLQIGNENIELIQVAWSGAKYKKYFEEMEINPEKTDWSKFAEQMVIWPERLDRPEAEPPQLFEALVDKMEQLAKVGDPQFKPWPNPLPTRIALGGSIPERGVYLAPGDRAYLQKLYQHVGQEPPETGFYLNPVMAYWLNNSLDPEAPHNPWFGVDWSQDAMRAIVGLVDHPANASQRLLIANLRRGHLAMFGASGWGKTTFLRTLVTSLAIMHAPEELHVYILDFGGRSLEVLRDLPHVGSVIRPDETEKIQRLLRKLDNELDRRKQIFSETRARDLYEYNDSVKNNPDREILPAMLIVIDNFAEVRENMESLLPTITSLVREGLASGVHFVTTGDTPGTLGKLYGLFTERMTVKMADAAEYMNVVGRGVPGMEEIAGRGYMAINRTPLELQVAMPLLATSEEGQQAGETGLLGDFVEQVNRVWYALERDRSVLPQPIEELPTFTVLWGLIEAVQNQALDVPHAVIGIDDATLEPALLDFKQIPHFLISGQQQTGKTTAMRNIILSLAQRYSPAQVGMVLVDRLGFLFNYSGRKSLAELPHVLATVTEPAELKDVLQHLRYEYETLEPSAMQPREVFIFIDNYDDFDELKPDKAALSSLTRSKPERPLLHFVVAGSTIKMRQPDDIVRRISRYGLAMENSSVQAMPFNVNLKKQLREAELPLGRGFVVRTGKARMVQVASQSGSDASLEESLDFLVIQGMRPWREMEKASWIPIPEDAATQDGDEGYTPEQIAYVEQKMIESGKYSRVTIDHARKYGTSDEDLVRDAIQNEIIKEDELAEITNGKVSLHTEEAE